MRYYYSVPLHIRGVSYHPNFPHLAGHAEVAQLAVPVAVQQKVAALDVSMDQLLTVQVFQRFCSLDHMSPRPNIAQHTPVIYKQRLFAARG